MVKPLLPSGCYDLLPPFARQESLLSSTLLSVFESYGYEQVSPPMLEYSDGLLSGRGATLSNQTFRVMDQVAGKVMGLRPDITLQIARIAASRLATVPRPLRLSYNGLILRMQGDQFKSDRQLRQTGIELIGAASPEADAEVILVAARALHKAGITTLSIDLNLPGIVGALLAEESLSNDALHTLFEAVSHKDISVINTLTFTYRDTLIALLQSAGPAATALPAMEKLALPESARKQINDLRDVTKMLTANDLTVTIDAAEVSGFDYHSGISFSIFVPGAACEVGRGGRYRIDNGEEATGFTLYVDTLRKLLPKPTPAKRLLVNEPVDIATLERLQAEGYITLHGLSEYGAGEEEARRLGCKIIYDGKTIRDIS